MQTDLSRLSGPSQEATTGGSTGARRILALSPSLGLLAMLAAGCSLSAATDKGAGPAAGIESAPPGIAALGRLQPRGGLIDVAGTPGMKVGSLSVREGQVVKPGDLLFVLDSFSILAAQAEAAEARLRDAQSLYELEAKQKLILQGDLDLEEAKLERLDPLDLQATEAQVESKQLALDKFRADLGRLNTLRQKGSTAVSDQELESSRLQVKAAEAEVKVAQVQKEKLQQAQALGRKRLVHDREKLGLATERAQLAAQLATARATSDAARQQRDAARVVAPRGGQVLRIVTREGESIGGQPVLQMGDTGHMVVVAEVSELDILRLQKAAAAGPTPAVIGAIGGQLRLAGRLDAAGIGRVVGKNRLSSLNPTFQADDRVVEVEVDVDPGDEAALTAARGLSNLQVEVTFPLGDHDARPAAAADPPAGEARGRS